MRLGLRRIHGSQAATILLLVVVLGVSLGAKSMSKLMEQGAYSQVISELREQESRRPRDAKVKRNLGIALLESGDASAAVRALSEARALKPRDTTTLFHLGRAAEKAGDLLLALDAYGSYLERTDQDAAAVRARIQVLTHESARVAARQAIEAEKKLRLEHSASNTVAVPEFYAPVASDTLRPLARGLATVLMTDLGRVPELRVVERARLQTLLDELGMAKEHGAVDKKTAPRLGKLLAARRFAQGTLVSIGTQGVQLDAVLFDASNATTRDSGEPVSGDLTEVLVLEKRLAFQVLDSLGIVVTPEVRNAIGEPPTRSFPAFLAFSRGIEFEDRGLPDLARQAYDEAARIDPGFRMARMRRDELAVTPLEQARVEEVSVHSAFAGGSSARLMQAGSEIGLATVPADATATSTPVSKVGTARITVRVQVPQ